MSGTESISCTQERSFWTVPGLLYERFEALKKELEEMGMFAARVQTAGSTHMHVQDRGCDRTDRSCNPRYHQCGKEKESICAADPALSCTGTG